MQLKAFVLVGSLLCTLLTAAQVKLPRLVRDSMVLQRDVPLKLWGWATPGEVIQVQFRNKQYKTTADKDKKWMLRLPPQQAGGPFHMTINASNRIILKDVLVGDVWICAGQSNMVHQMALHQDTYAADIAGANNPYIRQFVVPNRSNLTSPEADLSSGAWMWANPENVRQFSAVAYFFAQNIYNQHKVPIGIINASFGGTPIEAWTSEEGLAGFPELNQIIQRNKDTAFVNGCNREAFAVNTQLNKRENADAGMALKWFDTGYVPKGWRNIIVPGYWEDQGVRNLDGVVWYRKEIEVPPAMAGVPAKMYLGRIVDADQVYVNGVRVGNTMYQYPQRRYPLPAGLLHAGKNLIVVRVVNHQGKGGFVPDKPYFIEAGEHKLSLQGDWQYRVGTAFVPQQTMAGIAAQNQPAALFNAMVAPLQHYAVKGVLWYQGESNAGDPIAYRKLLPAFIRDWRKHRLQPDLPFVLVQLPNFMEADYLPAESNWALMREAQAAALALPYTALAVTIDLGEWNDIHPDNKKDVGVRAALAARKLVYGEQLVHSGPTFAGAELRGKEIRVWFTNTGSGLVTNNGAAPGAFAIAGADKKFVSASTRIDGDTVIVWNDAVIAPLYVRYAWADNPPNANLYNKEGLPAAPFRTDTHNQVHAEAPAYAH